jgi:hypothetical protein
VIALQALGVLHLYSATQAVALAFAYQSAVAAVLTATVAAENGDQATADAATASLEQSAAVLRQASGNAEALDAAYEHLERLLGDVAAARSQPGGAVVPSGPANPSFPVFRS